MTKVIKREHAERARAHESVLSVPEVMRTAPGIAIQGRKIRSLVFSTDLAVICHCDADAVLAVYPFTCQPAITQALVAASQRPVFNGVGGSITQGERCVEAALHSEMSGVAAVVVNTSIPVESISALVEKVAVPVCVTACAADDVVHRQIAAGASIVNVAAGAAHATGGGGFALGIPRPADHRHGRPDRRRHPRHHCGRGRRRQLDAAGHCRSGARGDGEGPSLGGRAVVEPCKCDP